MNTKRAVKRLLEVVGAIALVLLLAASVYGILTIRRGFSARGEPSKLETWVARAVRGASIPSRAKTLKNPVRSTAEVLTEAQAHWADHCSICHANNGSGDSPMGKNMYPKPPDMRTSATQQLSDGELYWIIQNGVRLTGMPAWGESRDDDKSSWALVAFIRHLPSLTRDEEEEMRKLNPQSAHERNEEKTEEEFLNEQDNSNGEKP